MIRAVITGAFDASATSLVEYQKAIESIARDFNHTGKRIRIALYSGGILQVLINDPSDGLKILLTIKTGLRRISRNPNSDHLQSLLDARLSLGLGSVVDNLSMDLCNMRGEAFSHSVRALENMNTGEHFIRITTGNQELNDQFAAVTPLMDAIIQRWTKPQSAAVYLYLVHAITQREIGEKLNISQRAAGKRLEASNIENILSYNEYFKNLLNSL